MVRRRYLARIGQAPLQEPLAAHWSPAGVGDFAVQDDRQALVVEAALVFGGLEQPAERIVPEPRLEELLGSWHRPGAAPHC